MIKQYISNQPPNRRQLLIAALVVLTVATTGTAVHLYSHAATPSGAFEAESGTLTGGATLQTDSTASGGQSVKFGSGTTLLSWAPPVCGGADGDTCIDLTLTNTGSHQTPSLSPNVDYRIHLPASGSLVGGITINGGHNVQIIGGEIDFTPSCTAAVTACMGIQVARESGTGGMVFIEGVWIKNQTSPLANTAASYTGDGIDAYALPSPNQTNITLENIRIDRIDGCDPGDTNHADIIQFYGIPNSAVKIDGLTGSSDCQGMNIDPDYTAGTFGPGTEPSYDIRNVDIYALNNPHTGNIGDKYTWWITGGPPECTTGGVSLTNDWAAEPNGTLSINSIWPDTDQPAGCKGVWNAGANTYTFPNTNSSALKITGGLKQGTPPGGDFVLGNTTGGVGVAGYHYVSPGYAN